MRIQYIWQEKDSGFDQSNFNRIYSLTKHVQRNNSLTNNTNISVIVICRRIFGEDENKKNSRVFWLSFTEKLYAVCLSSEWNDARIRQPKGKTFKLSCAHVHDHSKRVATVEGESGSVFITKFERIQEFCSACTMYNIEHA